MGAVSWPALCELFESKVDSLMDMGRWLFIMVEDAEKLVCEAYDHWEPFPSGHSVIRYLEDGVPMISEDRYKEKGRSGHRASSHR